MLAVRWIHPGVRLDPWRRELADGVLGSSTKHAGRVEIDDTSITRVRFDDRGAALVSVNDRAHLEDASADGGDAGRSHGHGGALPATHGRPVPHGPASTNLSAPAPP